MTIVSRSIEVNAAPHVVWEAFADVGEIGFWRRTPIALRVLTDSSGGVGAKRRWEDNDGGYSIEEIVEWSPPSSLALRTVETNTSIETSDMSFQLEPKGAGTRVTVSDEYTLRHGRLGRVADILFGRDIIRSSLKRLLKDLKKHVESGGPTRRCS